MGRRDGRYPYVLRKYRQYRVWRLYESTDTGFVEISPHYASHSYFRRADNKSA